MDEVSVKWRPGDHAKLAAEIVNMRLWDWKQHLGLSNGLQSVLWEKRTMGVGGDEGEPFMYLRAKWEGNAAALSSRVSQRPRRIHIVLSEEKK